MESKTNFTLGRNLQLVLLLLHPHKFKEGFKFPVLQSEVFHEEESMFRVSYLFFHQKSEQGNNSIKVYEKTIIVTAELLKGFFHYFPHFS